MRISAISDVHVKVPHDAADKLLLQFLTHPIVLESDYVVLLGDIFDLMTGPHPQYLKNFAHLFEQIDSLMKSGKKVFFLEGNHDVHLEKLFIKYWPKGDLRPSQLPIVEKIDGKSYYFSHGDEHDVHNKSYHNYKNFILTPPLKFVANHLMPYSVLNFIGERASRMSRKKGSKGFDEEKVRIKFREGVQLTTAGQALDFIIGGHSHVKDNFLMANGKTVYLNNGYALKSKTFLTIKDHQVSFVQF
ncbi:MAG TPA: metallophosphoesterase [Bacteriovoracaceae bacterium]|nr:metallophosphoesterase [Bacteriovoracaceae bacterium]